MKILGLPGIKEATGPWMDRVLDGIDVDAERQTQYYEGWKSGGGVNPRLEI